MFTGCKDVRDAFLARTSSGLLGVNVPMLQLGVPGLPFGGVGESGLGESGMGAYQGEHSVRVFSHEQAVLRKRRRPNLAALARQPFADRKPWMLRGSSGGN